MGDYVCPVCLDSVDELNAGNCMRALECLHSVCSTCLPQLLKGSTIACPKCRDETKVPMDDIKHLEPNWWLMKTDMERWLKKTFKCPTCKTTQSTVEITFCHHCKKYLCNSCRVKHINGKRAIGINSAGCFCAAHKRKMAYICKQCQINVCPVCVHLPVHTRHKSDIVPLTYGCSTNKFTDFFLLMYKGVKTVGYFTGTLIQSLYFSIRVIFQNKVKHTAIIAILASTLALPRYFLKDYLPMGSQ